MPLTLTRSRFHRRWRWDLPVASVAASAALRLSAANSDGNGGEGSRTPVLEMFSASFYRYSLVFALAPATRTGTIRKTEHACGLSRSPPRALRPEASLLSSLPASAGVKRGTSRSIKPREPGQYWRLIFDPIFYEANGSSSTCHQHLRPRVETSAPPYFLGKRIIAAGDEMSNADCQTPNLEFGVWLVARGNSVFPLWRSAFGLRHFPHALTGDM
jgi:hypothetical protein